jgi:hypothetical protein
MCAGRRFMRVFILLSLRMCPHTLTHTDTHAAICVLVAALCVSSYCSLYSCVLILSRILTLMLLHVSWSPLCACPHTALSTHVSSYSHAYSCAYYYMCAGRRYIRVLILLYVCPHTVTNTTIYVCCSAAIYGSSRFFYFFHDKKILLHMCATTCVCIVRR